MMALLSYADCPALTMILLYISTGVSGRTKCNTSYNTDWKRDKTTV